MENLLRGIPFVVVRVDDILVSGSNDEHLVNLEEVLKRLSETGLRLKREKCVFMMEEVVYLSQKINRQGIQPIEEKVRAIIEAPAPKNVSEVRSLPGNDQLLPEIFTELVYNSGTFAWPFGKREKLEMDGVASRVIHEIRRVIEVFGFISPL